MEPETLAREDLQKKIYNLLIEKMDRASIIKDAVEYIENLLKQGPMDVECLHIQMHNRIKSKLYETLVKSSSCHERGVKNCDSGEVFRSESSTVKELSNEDSESSEKRGVKNYDSSEVCRYESSAMKELSSEGSGSFEKNITPSRYISVSVFLALEMETKHLIWVDLYDSGFESFPHVKGGSSPGERFEWEFQDSNLNPSQDVFYVMELGVVFNPGGLSSRFVALPLCFGFQ